MIVSPPFHLQLYYASESIESASASEATVVLSGKALRTYASPPQFGFFPTSFESLISTMTSWSGVFAEWDGSWGWVASEKDEHRRPLWRLDGMIYDRDQKVFYIELQGQCTLDAWRLFLAALGVTDTNRLAICWTHEGLWLNQNSFETWLTGDSQI